MGNRLSKTGCFSYEKQSAIFFFLRNKIYIVHLHSWALVLPLEAVEFIFYFFFTQTSFNLASFYFFFFKRVLLCIIFVVMKFMKDHSTAMSYLFSGGVTSPLPRSRTIPTIMCLCAASPLPYIANIHLCFLPVSVCLFRDFIENKCHIMWILLCGSPLTSFWDCLCYNIYSLFIYKYAICVCIKNLPLICPLFSLTLDSFHYKIVLDSTSQNFHR